MVWFSIAASIASIISAGTALIAVIFQVKQQKNDKKEKREMAKARFSVIGGTISGKKLLVNIHNAGNKYLYNINSEWVGEGEADISVSKVINMSCPYEYIVELNFKDDNVKKIEGNLVVKYSNIYGESESTEKKILIEDLKFKTFKGDFN